MVNVNAATEIGVGTRVPLISHDVKPFVREQVGIPEGVPVALMVHLTKGDIGYDIHKYGFVNVSGRGTLVPITDNSDDPMEASVPKLAESFTGRDGDNVAMLTFCVPAELLKADVGGSYGYWYDNRISQGEYPELWEIYDKIVVEYSEDTGEPLKYAKDDSTLYPVVVPPQFIYDVVYPTAFVGQKAGDK